MLVIPNARHAASPPSTGESGGGFWSSPGTAHLCLVLEQGYPRGLAAPSLSQAPRNPYLIRALQLCFQLLYHVFKGFQLEL